MDVERLLEAAWPDAFRIAYGITRDHGLAEDAAQEACLQAYRSFAQLRDPAIFRPWLYRIVVRSATSLSKKRRRDAQLTDIVHSASGPTENRIAIASALDRLTPAQRAAVVLHYYAGLNGREIAEVTGVTHGAVRLRLFLAKRRLQALLAVDEIPKGSDEVTVRVR